MYHCAPQGFGYLTFLLDDLAFLGDKLEVGLLFDDLRFLLVHLLHEVLLALGLLVLDLAHGY